MKKLMIAAAIVCAAVVSHAATVNWAVQSGANVQGAGEKGVFNGTALSGEAVVTIQAFYYATEDARDAVLSGDVWAAYEAGEMKAAKQSAVKSATGKAIALGFNASIDVTDLSTTPQPLWGIAVLTLDETGDGDVDWYIVNYADSEITSQGKATMSTNMATAHGNTGWTAVPEPTSGLLLLLGVAGLALRRRRA